MHEMNEGIVCDFCFREDFGGKRYTCCECSSYNLCENCFSAGETNKGHLPSHTMLRKLTRSQFELVKDYLKAESLPTKTKEDINSKCEQESACITPSLTGNLVNDLRSLFLDESTSDMTFIVKGKMLKAHKTILRARCPELFKMYQSNIIETSSGSVCIGVFEFEVVQAFFGYLYMARVTADDLRKNAIGLFKIADRFSKSDLKDVCINYMQSNIDDILTVDSFCDILKLALDRSDSDLLLKLKAFLAANLRTVIKTDKWKTFNKENSDVANDLVSNALSNGR